MLDIEWFLSEFIIAEDNMHYNGFSKNGRFCDKIGKIFVYNKSCHIFMTSQCHKNMAALLKLNHSLRKAVHPYSHFKSIFFVCYLYIAVISQNTLSYIAQAISMILSAQMRFALVSIWIADLIKHGLVVNI